MSILLIRMFAQTIVRTTGMVEQREISKSLLSDDTAFILLFDDKGSCHLGAKLEFLLKTKKTRQCDTEIFFKYMEFIN